MGELKHGMELKQILGHKLSAAHQQLIKLLPVTSINLETELFKLAEENPVLEVVDEEPNEKEKDDSESEFENQEELKEENTLETYEQMKEMYASYSDGVYYDDDGPEFQIKNEKSPYELLREQIKELNLNEKDEFIADFIIGNLNNDGLLDPNLSIRKIKSKLNSTNPNLNVSEEDVERVLKILQKNLDPPGIAARNVQESLLIQLERLPDSEEKEIAIKLLTKYKEKLENKHYKQIMRSLKIDETKLQEVLDYMKKKLNPKPISFYTSTMPGVDDEIITPDFQTVVDKKNGTVTARLIKYKTPTLRVSPKFEERFAQLVKKKKQKKKLTEKEKKEMEFLEKKLRYAYSTVQAINSRKDVLEKIMNFIVNHQKEYFLKDGDEKEIKPLILEDVEKAVKLDKSSISRATSNKYIKTHFGIIPVRKLFAEAINKKLPKEQQISNTKIKAILREIIENEDKRKPYNDDQLKDVLKEKYGIEVARRTVAKYREELGYPRGGLRKELI